MGGNPEKLLTLEEAARHLDVPPDDVEALIRSGKLPAFHLGGSFLRIRLKDVEAAKIAFPRAVRTSHDRRSRHTDRLSDFLYFNDFYLISILIILILLAVILAL